MQKPQHLSYVPRTHRSSFKLSSQRSARATGNDAARGAGIAAARVSAAALPSLTAADVQRVARRPTLSELHTEGISPKAARSAARGIAAHKAMEAALAAEARAADALRRAPPPSTKTPNARRLERLQLIAKYATTLHAGRARPPLF